MAHMTDDWLGVNDIMSMLGDLLLLPSWSYEGKLFLEHDNSAYILNLSLWVAEQRFKKTINILGPENAKNSWSSAQI